MFFVADIPVFVSRNLRTEMCAGWLDNAKYFFGPDHHVTRTNTVLRVFGTSKANSAIQVAPVNPRPFLQELTGKMVAVKLKWGLEYRGFLVATDAYMNLQVRFLTLFSSFLAGWINVNVFAYLRICARSLPLLRWSHSVNLNK